MIKLNKTETKLPEPSIVQLTQSDYLADESSGVLGTTITATRTGNTQGDISIPY